MVLDGALTCFEVEDVALRERPVELSEGAIGRIQAAISALRAVTVTGRAIYGVNTGFGSLANQRVPEAELTELQHNLIRSHAAGVGEPLPRRVVRAMGLLLAASLARGHSGVRLELVQTILDMLNAGVTPVVPSRGSVGASGDLAPLAHFVEVMLGEGRAEFGGKVMGGGEALRSAGISPIELGPKEGLALINGTHLMAGSAALTVCKVRRIFDAALSAAAVSMEAARVSHAFLDARVHEARGQVGQIRVAAALRSLLRGSVIAESHAVGDDRVQDPYSMRCTPQVLGAALDQIDHCAKVVERELGAVTDNPLIFPTENGADVISAGNFHGMPLAIAMDTLTIALSHIAGISERRVFLLLGARPEYLSVEKGAASPFRAHLTKRPGTESGYMITQYTAAACCNEIVNLASPASVSNIPTCAGMEDYNSFGPRAAAKAAMASRLCRSVIAIELLCGTEAIEYLRPLKSGSGVERAYATVRSTVSALTGDRTPAPDIASIEGLIEAGRFG